MQEVRILISSRSDHCSLSHLANMRNTMETYFQGVTHWTDDHFKFSMLVFFGSYWTWTVSAGWCSKLLPAFFLNLHGVSNRNRDKNNLGKTNTVSPQRLAMILVMDGQGQVSKISRAEKSAML